MATVGVRGLLPNSVVRQEGCYRWTKVYTMKKPMFKMSFSFIVSENKRTNKQTRIVCGWRTLSSDFNNFGVTWPWPHHTPFLKIFKGSCPDCPQKHAAKYEVHIFNRFGAMLAFNAPTIGLWPDRCTRIHTHKHFSDIWMLIALIWKISCSQKVGRWIVENHLRQAGALIIKQHICQTGVITVRWPSWR